MLISKRALEFYSHPRFFQQTPSPAMKHYPGEGFELAVELQTSANNVKKLSFWGNLPDWEQVLLESWASIMMGRSFSQMDQLTLRECEAFLRDKNSEPALQSLPAGTDEKFKRLFDWIKRLNVPERAVPYHFSSEKRPFRNLKLADKVRELKGFLNSPEIIELYQGLTPPTLLDVDDLTVYLEVSYGSESERVLLEDLHMLGVEAFQEESLNFIPEA